MRVGPRYNDEDRNGEVAEIGCRRIDWCKKANVRQE